MKEINAFEKKSILNTLRYVVNFIWYAQLVIVALILIKTLIHSFSSENSFSWPVYFVATVQEDIVSQSPNVLIKGIRVNDGTLLFDTKNDWQANIMMLLGILIVAFPFIIVTYYIRKVLNSFMGNTPFLKSNLRRIRFIGTLLVLYPIIVYIFGFFYIGYLNANFEGYEFVNSVTLWPLFFGLFALVLSEVFRLGIEYREDHNLTI